METVEVVRARRWAPLLAWLVGLGLTLALFHSLGSGALAAPPAHPDGWERWAEGRDPLIVTMAVLRLVVLGLVWYLLVATVLGTLARVWRAARLVAVVDVITVPALRGFLRGALGVSLATAMISAAPLGAGLTSRAHAGSAPTAFDLLPVQAPDEVAVTVDGPGHDTGRGAAASEALAPMPLPLELASELERPAATLSVDADDRADDATDHPAAPVGERDAAVVSSPQATDAQHVDGAAGTVTVAPGDSLWSIARDALLAAGQDPDDAEVRVYWSALVEHQRPMLADPSNPDLIFPGDTVVLPELPDRSELWP